MQKVGSLIAKAVARAAAASPYLLLGDRVLVRPDPAEAQAVHGLLGKIEVVGSAQRPAAGIVIAHGPGAYQHGVFVPVSVRAGWRVNYGKHAGQAVEIDGEELLMLREADLFGYWDTTSEEEDPE